MKENAHYIQVGEHQFELPPLPSKKDIFFSDKPKEEQYWRRDHTQYPKIFFDWYHPHPDSKKGITQQVEENAEKTVYENGRLKSLSLEDTRWLQRLVEEEQRRFREGVWFMNNGNPTYLTGTHYGVLQWMPFKGSFDDVNHSQYGMYMRLQRDYCYFREVCKATTLARGGNVVKAKKQGITQLEACCIGLEAIQQHNALYRIMSISEDVAIESCMAYLKYAIQRMPPILLPFLGKENMSEVTFGKPDGTKGTRNKVVDRSVDYLETTIRTVATNARSFDSLTNTWAWIDEQSKIEEASPKETHDVTVATVMIGAQRKGTIWYTGYVAEKNNKSFMEARTIYYDSKLKTIKDGASQTKSKLLCFALLVWDGINGCIDKYGEPVAKLIKKFMDEELASFNGDEAKIQAFKRQYPQTEAECWELGAGEKSLFDNVRLGIKLSELNENESINIYPYFEFNFKWSEPPTIDTAREVYNFPGKVYLERINDDDKRKGIHGLFRWYREEYLPNGFMNEWANNTMKWKNGKIGPRPESPFYAAMDPTDYASKKDVAAGSHNSMQVFILPDAEIDARMGKCVTNKRLIASYYHRAENPEDTLMHCIQLILFFGCPILIESNRRWMVTRLINAWLGNFLIYQDENGMLVPYKASDPNQKPFTTQTGSVDYYVRAGMIQYGINENSDQFDNIDNLEDEDTIKDLILFDPKNTKVFDAGMCHLIGLHGIASYLGHREKMKKKNQEWHREAMAKILRVAID